MSETIAGVEVPDTAAVAEATRLVQETTTPLIYHHSRRVFFFGQIHAHRLGVKPDPELLYLAAMFHDTGLVTPFSDAEQRFEVDGADHGRKFLLDRGFSTAAAETVWTAIALHTTPGIPGRMGPEIATTHLGVAIIIEAALGFLGVGIPPPTPTWGNMLSDALNAGLVPPWWLVLFPGVAITITVLAFNLLGDGIRDLLDPRLRGSV